MQRERTWSAGQMRFREIIVAQGLKNLNTIPQTSFRTCNRTVGKDLRPFGCAQGDIVGSWGGMTYGWRLSATYGLN